MFKLRTKRGQQEQGLRDDDDDGQKTEWGERERERGAERQTDGLDGDASLEEYFFEVGMARKDKLRANPTWLLPPSAHTRELVIAKRLQMG